MAQTHIEELHLSYNLLRSLAENGLFNTLSVRNNNVFIDHVVSQKIDKIEREEDFALLNSSYSFMGLVKKECFQVIAFTDLEAISFSSKIYTGSKNEASNFNKLNNVMKSLEKRAKDHGLLISHFEIKHTHVSHQKLINNFKTHKSTLVTHALSESDIKLGQILKNQWHRSIIIKALHVDGVCYSYHF